MNVQKLLNDDDYFSDWFINQNMDELIKLAKVQGYLHHLSIFFESHNIN